MPRQTLVLDSSQISTYLECQIKWQYSYEECLALTDRKDPAMEAGSLGHLMLEQYYKLKDTNPSLAFTNALACDSPDVEEDVKSLLRERIKLYIMTYHEHDFKPLTRPVHHIVADGLLVKDEIRQEPLVEKGFAYELLNTSEYLFVLEGRIDLLASMSGNNIWADHKFQFRERDIYEKSIQFRNYSLATHCNIGIVNYIRLHQAVKDTTFKRQVINFSSLDMRMWREELIDLYVSIANNPRRRNWDSCGGKYGYKCPYTQICEVFYNPSLVQVMKGRYVTREKWTPWE